MYSTRAHHPIVGQHWSSANVSITLLLALLFFILLFLLLVITAQPAYAQNSVPPTARQAATMPQFASRLHPSPQTALRPGHPYPPQASYRTPADRRGHGWLPDDIVYTNGPINGTTDAWSINLGFIVSNTLTLPSGGASVSGLTFGAWLAPGDVLQSVEVSISSDPLNGGTIYFDRVVSFTQSGCIGNQYGYNVCTETSATFGPTNLNQGTYWLNLQNAVVNTGDPVYWDENSGRSMAIQNDVGTIPSEAFTVLGSGTTTCFICPECVHDKPQDNFKVIHSFIGNEQSPAPGLAIDSAERVYGTTDSGGSHQKGLAYQLAPHGQDWLFTPLYNFIGGVGGQNPLPEIIGPQQSLYGTANGGFQNCAFNGSDSYCGVIYRLRPTPTVCLTALCSWNETVIYRFMGAPDGARPNGNLVVDAAGNLYGTTYSGGAYGGGAIYKLTPNQGGWTEKVIHSFTGGSDGVGPNSLLLGQDGNLYGTAFGGDGGYGVIFQLTPSGDSWTLRVIASYGTDGPKFPRLIQTYAGNFYGLVYYSQQFCPPLGCFNWEFSQIFKMSPAENGWQFTVLDDTYYVCQPAQQCYSYDGGVIIFRDLTIDSAGNLYGAWGWQEGGNFEQGAVFKLLEPYQEQGLAGFSGDNFRDLQAGPSGKIYGTTRACGSFQGTVWQLTPP